MVANFSQGIALLGRTPSRPSPEASKLTYQEKFSRVAARLRDPQWRHYGMLLLVGKALGIAVLFGMITIGTTLIRSVSGTPVHAQQAAPAASEAAAMPTSVGTANNASS